MYEPRDYRRWTEGTKLVSCGVTVRETDLYIAAGSNLKRKAQRLVHKYRDMLESYISRHPDFTTATNPLPPDPNAPQIIATMLNAALKTGVGPMAGVAGAIAESVGRELLAFSPEIIVENGGDIFMRSFSPKVIGVYAGSSPLSGAIGIEVAGDGVPVGICTSSGTVGHSLSYGRADAVVIVAPDTTLADAAATAIGNLIQDPADIERGLQQTESIPELAGVIIIVGKEMGIRGDIRLCETTAAKR